MFSVVSKKLALSLSVSALTVGVFLLPPRSLAADDLVLTASTPVAYLESAQIFGTGNQIKVYRLPATDSKGKMRYWDVALDLTLNSTNGKPMKVSVTSTPSPNVYSNEFIPGTYFSELSNGFGSATCTVTTGVLNGGRMQVAFACTSSMNSHMFSGSAISGPITGHPFALDLLAAGIDQIAGYENYSWGKVGSISNDYYPWWTCMQTGEVISAQQVGSSIVLSGYDTGNVQKCGVTLVKQE